MYKLRAESLVKTSIMLIHVYLSRINKELKKKIPANVYVTIQSHGLSAGARTHYVTANGVRDGLGDGQRHCLWSPLWFHPLVWRSCMKVINRRFAKGYIVYQTCPPCLILEPRETAYLWWLVKLDDYLMWISLI